MEKQLGIKGGEFLLKQTKSNDVFIPEEFNEEQKMIAQTCNDFLETEVFPILERIDHQEDGLMEKLVKNLLMKHITPLGLHIYTLILNQKILKLKLSGLITNPIKIVLKK